MLSVGGQVGRALRRVGRRLSPPFPRELGQKFDPYPRAELIWWKPKTGFNFGDVLSEVIVTKVLADSGRTLLDQTHRSIRLLAIGSILHFAMDGDVVWGSGVNGKKAADQHKFTTLDVRAVRGPLTASFLRGKGIVTPDVYGDPALLLPRLFPHLKPTPKVPLVVIPNLNDIDILDGEGRSYVSPTLGWNVCVQRILEAEFVIASSLHAIIVAEAFGIPARIARFSEREPPFKYEDYLLGTGRQDLELARTVAEGCEMGGMPAPSFDADRLLKAFPLDLWL